MSSINNDGNVEYNRVENSDINFNNLDKKDNKPSLPEYSLNPATSEEKNTKIESYDKLIDYLETILEDDFSSPSYYEEMIKENGEKLEKSEKFISKKLNQMSDVSEKLSLLNSKNNLSPREKRRKISLENKSENLSNEYQNYLESYQHFKGGDMDLKVQRNEAKLMQSNCKKKLESAVSKKEFLKKENSDVKKLHITETSSGQFNNFIESLNIVGAQLKTEAVLLVDANGEEDSFGKENDLFSIANSVLELADEIASIVTEQNEAAWKDDSVVKELDIFFPGEIAEVVQKIFDEKV